ALQKVRISREVLVDPVVERCGNVLELDRLNAGFLNFAVVFDVRASCERNNMEHLDLRWIREKVDHRRKGTAQCSFQNLFDEWCQECLLVKTADDRLGDLVCNLCFEDLSLLDHLQNLDAKRTNDMEVIDRCLDAFGRGI